MKLLMLLLATALVFFGASRQAHGEASRPPPAAEQNGLAVYFSPRGGCTDAIVAELNAASKSIDLMAYSMTSARIAKALTDAHTRGVQVRAVLDKSNWTARYSAATFLLNHGVPTYIDAEHAIMHNKVIIIDGTTVITGSFNFSSAAEESNAENLLILKGFPDVVTAYVGSFEDHLGHSEAYTGPRPAGGSENTDQAEPPSAPASSPDAGRESAAGTGQVQPMVYVSSTGNRYHRANCRTLQGSKSSISLKDAQSRGLTSCGICRP